VKRCDSRLWSGGLHLSWPPARDIGKNDGMVIDLTPAAVERTDARINQPCVQARGPALVETDEEDLAA